MPARAICPRSAADCSRRRRRRVGGRQGQGGRLPSFPCRSPAIHQSQLFRWTPVTRTSGRKYASKRSWGSLYERTGVSRPPGELAGRPPHPSCSRAAVSKRCKARPTPRGRPTATSKGRPGRQTAQPPRSSRAPPPTHRAHVRAAVYTWTTRSTTTATADGLQAFIIIVRHAYKH